MGFKRFIPKEEQWKHHFVFPGYTLQNLVDAELKGSMDEKIGQGQHNFLFIDIKFPFFPPNSLRDLLDCAPEESQWVLATQFSSQGLHKEKASDAWELFTEGKVLSLGHPKPLFPEGEVSG